MKVFKKFLSVLLTAMMLCTMCITATADDAYTITIDSTASGHTYDAYQVFTGDLSSKGVLSNVQWGAGVDKAALLTALQADTTIGSKFTKATTAADVAAAMSGITSDSVEAQAFAQVVGAHLLSDKISGTSTQKTDKTGYTIPNLTAGYYLVKDKDGTQTSTSDAYTKFILEVVSNVTAKPKSDVPTVTKKVQESNTTSAAYSDTADYSIGDTVPFQLTGTLPSNYADYKTYNYIFHDTASAGLTIDKASVKVKVGDTDISSNFTIDLTGQNLTVSCADLKKITGVTIDKGTSIVVTYTATLNSSAVIGKTGNDNVVNLEYSNNPNTTGAGTTGKTPDSKVLVFTYELDTTKVDKANKTKTLAGAEFELYKQSTDTDATKSYATVVDGKLTGWTTDEKSASTLTSGTDGLFKVAGLDAGTYYLKETKAPDGYNLLSSAVKVVITATTNSTLTTGDNLTALNISVNDATAVSGDTGTGVVAATIENASGSTLPSTGGIGTKVFTYGGIALMLLAGLAFAIKRKSSNVEK